MDARASGILPFLKRNIIFLANFVKNNQNCQFKLKIWYLNSFEHAEFNGGVDFSHFRMEIRFLDKFRPKNQNFQLNLKFSKKGKSNMKTSMVVFTFSLFRIFAFWANMV